MVISVVYYSLTGNNELLANDVAEKLRCGLIRIEETGRRTALKTRLDLLFGRYPRIEPSDAALDAYDHVVLVAPIWASKLATPLRSFIARERQRLPEYSFITLAGYERPGQADKLRAELARRVGRPPRAFCELHVADLFPAQQRHSIEAITTYRVRGEELERYRGQIDELSRAAGFEVPPWPAPAAQTHRPTPEAPLATKSLRS